MAATNIIPDVVKTAQAINGIVAPAIMISASALMVLALHAKYSQLIDRLRKLNDERRKLSCGQDQTAQDQRLSNVVEQIRVILMRGRFIRNSIMSLYTAISLFVLSSIVIGSRITLNINIPVASSVVIFMFGMICVLTGTIYAIRDISLAYKIAQLEVREITELFPKK